MRIVHETPDLLIVAERAVGMRLSGAVLAALGATLVVVGARAGRTAIGVVGAFMVVLGAMFVLLPAISTFYFNRGEKRLVIARRRVWTPTSQGYDEYPLADVNAVRVEEGRSSDDGGTTWRVVVRLADGRSIPFTSYYTSSYEPKAAMAARIANYLRVETNEPQPVGPGSPFAITPQSRRIAVGFALVFVAGGALFGSFGMVSLTREYRRLATWEPVQATVLGKRVDERYDSEGSTYRPEVTYRYSVSGRTYTSTRTLPINEGRSGGWAQRVIAPFSVGGTYTAWYDPANPSDAFIVRAHAIIPPVFSAIGLFVMLGGCATAVSALRQNRGQTRISG
jgi:hypothetical protein